MSNLEKYLNLPVSNLVSDSSRNISEEESERMDIYSLLLMAMVAYNFNGKKRGLDSKYQPQTEFDYGDNPLLSKTGKPVKRGLMLNKDYLGHNIAAFAVDRDGVIIDFDFNHNEIFNSSVQHAEARLLNRVFSLNQIYDSWNVNSNNKPESYGKLLSGVTVYTSLESCAQCSGIMTLGNVNEVVYLQNDDGQYKIGNIMYKLTEDPKGNQKALAPRPIAAKSFGFRFYDKLANAYLEFKSESTIASITSFLSSEIAFKIFLEAESAFSQISAASLKYPNWKKSYSDNTESKLSNSEVLASCGKFYSYFVANGRRGTPHI